MALPYFQTVKSFAEVPITEDGVHTESFLEASDGLVQLFDLLGIGVFSFVQLDLRSNITGVRNCYKANPEECQTLEKLVIMDANLQKRGGHHHDGTGCLRRLVRGLAFTCLSLKNSRENKSEDLYTSFRRSYDVVLRKHHNFAIRTVVLLAMKSVPHRNTFYTRIAQGDSQERLDALDVELAKWLEALDAIVKRIQVFYEKEKWPGGTI